MRKFAVSIALGAAFLASAAGGATKPVHGDGFSVRMPGEPQVKRNSMKIPAGNVAIGSWTSNIEGTLYSVGIVDYPAAFAAAQGSEKVIKTSEQELINQLKGVLKEEKPITIAGHPGTAFTVASDNGEVHARTYMVGSRLYSLLVLFNPSTGAGPDSDTFLNSLKLDKAAK